MTSRPSRPALAAFLAAALTCPLVIASAQAAGAAPVGPKKIEGQYIVTFKASTPDREVAAARDGSRGRGAKVRHTYSHALRGFAANMPAAEAERLRNDPRVQAVEPDYEVHASDVTQTGAVWGLDRLDQKALPLSGTYTYATDGTGVTAYVIDTGIRTTHAQFGGRATSAGFTAVNDGRGSSDCSGHGTHVAGTIGGSTYGVAKNVRLVPVRVLDCNGSGSNSGVIAGVDWVTANRSGPSVANMSLGGGASMALDTAVANSIASGVTYAVAAGNDNADACSYSPARLGAAITVGATTSTDARASFSNYGSCLDIFAPGDGIRSSVHSSDTATASYSGTSMASPHVAGVVAAYLQAVPTASPAAVRTALLAGSVTEVLSGLGTGSPGNLLQSALTTALPPPPPPPPPPPAGVAPVATAPVLALAASGSQLPTSGVPVRVSWSATDADGVSSYQLQRSTDGGSTWTTVTLPSPGATSVTLNQAAATALRFRVRATDTTGLTGAYATGGTSSLRLLQQNQAGVSYPAGTWATVYNSSASGGSLRQANSGRFTLSFTGSQVQWVGTPSTNRGRAEVFLDGVSQGVVDMYSSSTKFRRILFSGTTTPGAHTLEVRLLGTRSASSSGSYVDADAFVTAG